MHTVLAAYTLAEGATAPTRTTAGAAALDLYAWLPHYTMTLPPGERARIDTGVTLAVPPGYEAQVRPRLDLAWVHGLAELTPVTIDQGHSGRVTVALVNHGHQDVSIKHGDPIARVVFVPVADAVLTKVDALPSTQWQPEAAISIAAAQANRLHAAELHAVQRERDKARAELDALRTVTQALHDDLYDVLGAFGMEHIIGGQRVREAHLNTERVYALFDALTAVRATAGLVSR